MNGKGMGEGVLIHDGVSSQHRIVHKPPVYMSLKAQQSMKSS
jgi:hypothetical protein